MKSIVNISLLTGLILAGNASFAAVANDTAFLGEDENSPKVQAFYQGQCQKLAAGQSLSSGSNAYTEYMSQCLKDMKAVWPIGYDESE